MSDDTDRARVITAITRAGVDHHTVRALFEVLQYLDGRKGSEWTLAGDLTAADHLNRLLNMIGATGEERTSSDAMIHRLVNWSVEGQWLEDVHQHVRTISGVGAKLNARRDEKVEAIKRGITSYAKDVALNGLITLAQSLGFNTEGVDSIAEVEEAIVRRFGQLNDLANREKV